MCVDSISGTILCRQKPNKKDRMPLVMQPGGRLFICVIYIKGCQNNITQSHDMVTNQVGIQKKVMQGIMLWSKLVLVMTHESVGIQSLHMW